MYLGAKANAKEMIQAGARGARRYQWTWERRYLFSQSAFFLSNSLPPTHLIRRARSCVCDAFGFIALDSYPCMSCVQPKMVAYIHHSLHWGLSRPFISPVPGALSNTSKELSRRLASTHNFVAWDSTQP